MPFLKVYKMFVSNNEIGLKIIEKNYKRTSFIQMLKHCQKQNPEHQTLQSYLILRNKCPIITLRI